jgi:inorganic pyrophosphatase
VGAIHAEQQQQEDNDMYRNDRLIAVATQSLLYSNVQELDQLSPIVLQQIKDFFVNYQRVRGVKVNILGAQGAERARKILERAAKQKHAA